MEVIELNTAQSIPSDRNLSAGATAAETAAFEPDNSRYHSDTGFPAVELELLLPSALKRSFLERYGLFAPYVEEFIPSLPSRYLHLSYVSLIFSVSKCQQYGLPSWLWSRRKN